MAHHTTHKNFPGGSDWDQLVKRLNRFPQGAPPSKLLNTILKLLFSEKEAGLVSLMPIKPFTAEKAAGIWGKTFSETKKILDELCSRAILVDIKKEKSTVYALPPPMAGFFEFSLMRVRNDIDQKTLSELFYQYLNVEEDFVKELFTTGETQLGRVFINEPVLSNENALHVLDYERASHIIKSAGHRGISMCYCRHKMSHMGRACDAPMDICMTFNTAGRSLIKYGHAREVDVIEGLDLLDKAYESGLVQFGENVREGVNFICNCCGCCCEAMIAARRFGILQTVHTTNFIPRVDSDTCTGCGKCAETCPVEAMTLVSANNPAHPKKKKARLDTNNCLGCGLCARVCPERSITLESISKRVLTPRNTVERSVMMAVERGRLQDLIFDNRVLFSHRALAAVLGVILKLPPVKKALANRQLQSRYLDALLRMTGVADL